MDKQDEACEKDQQDFTAELIAPTKLENSFVSDTTQIKLDTVDCLGEDLNKYVGKLEKLDFPKSIRLDQIRKIF